MWTACLLISILLFIFYRTVKFWVLNPWYIHRDLWEQGVPGKYTPIIGEILAVRRGLLAEDPFSHSRQMVAKFGNYYHTSFGPFACLNISDPLLIEGVLKTNSRAYHQSLVTRLILGSLLGDDSLLLAEGEKHSRHRRLIAPVFQHKNINSMISLIADTTSQLLTKWAEGANVAGKRDQHFSLDIHEQMANLTLNIVTGCVFGTEMIKSDQAHNVIYRNLTFALNAAEKRIYNMIDLIPILNRLPLSSKRTIEKTKQDITHVVQRIIELRKKGLTKSACQGSPVISFSCFLYVCL